LSRDPVDRINIADPVTHDFQLCDAQSRTTAANLAPVGELMYTSDCSSTKCTTYRQNAWDRVL